MGERGAAAFSFLNFFGGRCGNPRETAEFPCMVVIGERRRAEPCVLDPGNRTERVLQVTSSTGWKNARPLEGAEYVNTKSIFCCLLRGSGVRRECSER